MAQIFNLKDVVQRTTQAIFAELLPLRMTGPEDEPKRKQLIDELQRNSDPINW